MQILDLDNESKFQPSCLYKELRFNSVKYLIDKDVFLVVTATNLETENLHKFLLPIPDFDKIVKCYYGNLTYYFGIFGKYKVVHVQCSMGSIAPSSSIATVNEALSVFCSKAVIMIGIAFGIDNKKQNIGDVLVAESILPYNSKRVGSDHEIHRGSEILSGPVLLNRFRSVKDWHYLLKDSVHAEILFSKIMSGEELIDNFDYREKLKSAYPDSKGGEMEGAGLYSACYSKKIECILVKGICDFADGEKGKNKKNNQDSAMLSAIDLCLNLFNSETAFSSLGIEPYTRKSTEMHEVKDVLFEFYDQKHERFYVERDNDLRFAAILRQFGAWICGPSGCGKSNLIVRNLIKHNKDFVQVDLSPRIGTGTEKFFEEILHVILQKNGRDLQMPISFDDCLKRIISLLEECYSNKEVIIFIEEIPISEDLEQQEFAQKLFALLISKNLKENLSGVKFFLSSIDNPKKFITPFQKKIHQQVSFLELEYWNEKDMLLLIDVLFTALNINLEQSLIDEVLLRSKGSPRFVKKFVRTIVAIDKYDEETVRFYLGEVEREF